MADGVNLKQFSVGSMDNNVYILTDSSTNESVLIDAPGDARQILDALGGSRLKYILMTHADGDHVTALREIKETTGAPIAINPAEVDRLPLEPDILLEDDQAIPFAGGAITVMYTPGHSPGGTSFLFDDLLFAGDTLFPGGPGNTNRADGNFQQIVESLRSRLFPLPDGTQVYPGHGLPTTIGREKPHLDEWIARGW
jgi:glyoxylase-like metal-dependent hydrolase (beta-lactamase superfamily II)